MIWGVPLNTFGFLHMSSSCKRNLRCFQEPLFEYPATTVRTRVLVRIGCIAQAGGLALGVRKKKRFPRDLIDFRTGIVHFAQGCGETPIPLARLGDTMVSSFFCRGPLLYQGTQLV